MAGAKKVTAPVQVGAEEMVMLVAIEPIRHDGGDIAPGEVFGVSATAAEILVAQGAAQAAQAAPAD